MASVICSTFPIDACEQLQFLDLEEHHPLFLPRFFPRLLPRIRIHSIRPSQWLRDKTLSRLPATITRKNQMYHSLNRTQWQLDRLRFTPSTIQPPTRIIVRVFAAASVNSFNI